MVNTPIPHSLRSEAKKAAKILQTFTVPSANVGPDKIIPAGLIMRAQGLAILTVAKIGFLVTARGGSGIVIAKLRGGGWSAPSAIGIAGLGGGFEIGAEVTDFVIILNTRAAVDAFSKGGNLTLGGNFTIAVGPLGRNAEADVSVRSPAAIYTYSKTKGLFAGISIEGSALIERKDANKKFYHEAVRSYDILNGNVDPPAACTTLYEVLSHHEEMFDKAMISMAKRESRKVAERQADRTAQSNPLVAKVMHMRRSSSKRKSSSSSNRSSTRRSSSSSSVFYTHDDDEPEGDTGVPHGIPRSQSMGMPQTHTTAKGSSSTEPDWNAIIKVKVQHEFIAQLPCDLSLIPGEEVEVLTKTSTQDDWWEGKLNGRVGIFPANYVQLI